MGNDSITGVEVTGDVRRAAIFASGIALGLDPMTLALICDVPAVGAKAGAPMKLDDLDSGEWGILRRHLSGSVTGRRESSPRRFINAVLWTVRHNSYRLLPPRYGTVATVRTRDSRWSETGLWEKLNAALQAEGKLTPQRLAEFQRVAGQARETRVRRAERRERVSQKFE